MSRERSPLFRILAGALALVFLVIFVALGTWQLERRVWKLDLIARVEQRVHAPPVTAPGPPQWAAVTAATDEYRHVAATGTFLDDSQTLVQAVTELGGGYWVLTPLREADGSIFLVNRGFVPSDARDRVQRADRVQPADQVLGTAAGTSTAVSVTGLLRMTEPRGAFLRHNDAAANRWYSRDVQAIAAARGLTRVAPYFIDADAGPSRAPGEGTAAAGAPVEGAGVAPGPGDPAGEAAREARVVPVGGLTVVAFRNSHLEYAITWYTLALMVAGATWLGIRSETRA